MRMISVLIPTYNRREKVVRAVASALPKVEGIDHEVIVLDDGSTDGTMKALRAAFASEISEGRLSLLQGEPGGDPAYARNRAAQAATGEFLAFLDSDDRWGDGRLAKVAQDLGSTDLIFEIPPSRRIPTDPLYWLLAGNRAVTSGTLIRRSLFWKAGGFTERYFGPKSKRFRGFEDYELWLNAVLELVETKAQSRVRILWGDDVIRETTEGGAGEMPLKTQMSREAVTLLKVSRRIPREYAVILARRLAGAAKAALLGG